MENTTPQSLRAQFLTLTQLSLWKLCSKETHRITNCMRISNDSVTVSNGHYMAQLPHAPMDFDNQFPVPDSFSLPEGIALLSRSLCRRALDFIRGLSLPTVKKTSLAGTAIQIATPHRFAVGVVDTETIALACSSPEGTLTATEKLSSDAFPAFEHLLSQTSSLPFVFTLNATFLREICTWIEQHHKFKKSPSLDFFCDSSNPLAPVKMIARTRDDTEVVFLLSPMRPDR